MGRYGKRVWVDECGDIYCKFNFSKSMKRFCGKKVTIQQTYETMNTYDIVEDNSGYIWTDDMFEPVDALQAITDEDKEVEELTKHIQKVFDVIQEKFSTPPSAETIANHLHLHNYRKTTLVEKDCSDWLHDHCCYDEQYELVDLFDEVFGVERNK